MGRGSEGSRAMLCGAILDEFNFSNRLLDRADLRKTRLQHANLTRARLADVLLNNADLTAARLDEAHLTGADLVGASLRAASLAGAHLDGANLDGAYLEDASMPRADFTKASLRGANLRGVQLHGSLLMGADISGADFRNAVMDSADLSEAVMGMSASHDTMPFRSQISTTFEDADLTGVIFEPLSTPEARHIASAQHLDRLKYRHNPGALIELRNSFREQGFRTQERQVTYALMRERTQRSPLAVRTIRTVMLDWTCKYGLSPFLPLKWLTGLWFLCTAFYALRIRFGKNSSLYLIQTDPSTRDSLQTSAPAEVTRVPVPSNKAVRFAALFSLMSTFNYSFQTLDFGRWVRNALPREFDLRAEGNARVVSGVQSLLSLFLITLAVLTYFGRPFDSLV
jgi:uncharacterized protein YjbI with pentapeptide repeats